MFTNILFCFCIYTYLKPIRGDSEPHMSTLKVLIYRSLAVLAVKECIIVEYNQDYLIQWRPQLRQFSVPMSNRKIPPAVNVS